MVLLVLVACSSTPHPVDRLPPPPAPAVDAGGGGEPPVTVRRELRRSFSLEVLGLDGPTSVANRMTGFLRAAAREFRAIHMGAANKELVDETLMFNCEKQEPACMSQIGKNLYVDELLFGKIEQVGPVFHVSLTLLDIETQIELHWTGTVQDADANLRDAARAAIATLVDRFR